MQGICIEYPMPTPDFYYRVVLLYPQEVYREEIFKTNHEQVMPLLKDYIEASEQLNNNKRVLNSLKFDSQKEKIKTYIRDNERTIKNTMSAMNKGISPYQWKIYKDVNEYDYDSHRYIKADYAVILK